MYIYRIGLSLGIIISIEILINVCCNFVSRNNIICDWQVIGIITSLERVYIYTIRTRF